MNVLLAMSLPPPDDSDDFVDSDGSQGSKRRKRKKVECTPRVDNNEICLDHRWKGGGGAVGKLEEGLRQSGWTVKFA